MAAYDRRLPVQVREWATEQGYDVGVRGRLSVSILSLFFAENPDVAKLQAALHGVTVPRGRLAKGTDPSERYVGLAEAVTGTKVRSAA